MEISFDVLEFGDARALDQLVSVFAKEFSKDPHEFVEKMGLERTALVEQLQWNDVPLPGVMNLYSG